MPAKSLLQEVLGTGNSDWLFFRTLPYRRWHPSFSSWTKRNVVKDAELTPQA